MKTLHLSIMIIVSVLVIVASSDWVHAQLPSGNLALRLMSISKSNFVDGEIIPVRGYTLPNSTINISLSDNLGNLENSTQVSSNNTGYFYTNLGIPSHVIGGGSWHIFAKSHNDYESIRIQVNTHGVVAMPDNFPSGLSPLKQFRLGIPTDAIQCHTSFQLVLNAEDDSPACVKLDTAYMLIKRGWATSESAYPGGDSQFALDTNSTIIPAHLPRSSGLEIPYDQPSRVINYSGFDGVYNETFQFRGTQNDYVLKPGSTGIITFKLEAVSTEQQGQSYPIPLPKSLNLTNYAIFYHEVTNLEDLSKYPGVTFGDNGNGGFNACSKGPAGAGSCIGGEINPTEAFVTDHPGIDVLFEPPSEVLPLDMNETSQVVTMTITADSDAPRGTYLVELPSVGLDSFLLTVGDKPYHE